MLSALMPALPDQDYPPTSRRSDMKLRDIAHARARATRGTRLEHLGNRL